jgi:hypothetical protein
MKRLICAFVTLTVLSLVMIAHALAAEPVVSKTVLTGDDGISVVLLNVRASDRTIYGITVSDESGSIEDIVAPKGWVAISSDSEAAFRTGDAPIAGGKTAAFRILTRNTGASLVVRFRDAKSHFGPKKTI